MTAVRDTIDSKEAAADIQRFLIHEARLLDEARYLDWLNLFTADAWYWVPSQPGQQSPLDTVSLMYDDRRLLETRVRRLSSTQPHAQEPPSRTSRIVANATLEETDADGTSKIVRSKLLMVEFRHDSQRLFAGTCLHRLVQTHDGFRIAWKRVDLINCDGLLEGLLVPF
ncbi:MAG TPA: aromatic-ring-hydroxylating dioxygenase subunit beta [Candidatus Binataceae bacterium]|nr:aromatic-ring-hydroxylating dioxygenase subunit beta [Candidatus Binataceae bacterium]